MLFAADKRPEIIQENDDLKITEVMKRVAEEWKLLDDKEKEPYNKKAKKLADKHAKEVEKYQNSAARNEYLAEKKEYEQKMAARRKRLSKPGAKPDEEEEKSKGSGSSPLAKRVRKSAAKTSSTPKKKS